MTRAETSIANGGPKTVAELLDHEEALALEKLTGSVQRLGDDLCVLADLRSRIQSRPLLATGVSMCLGFIASPYLARSARQVFAAGASVRKSSSLFPGLLLASLRGIRGLP